MQEAMRSFMARVVLFQEAVARSVGLNSSDLQTVGLLMSEGPASPGELAERIGMTQGGAITGLIDRLEKAGYVTVSKSGHGRGGVTTYTHNTKVKLNAMKRIELEETIDRAAYDELLRRADPACRTIEKTRYCVREGGFVWEIDVFPFWSDKAFLEVELPREDTPVAPPAFVRVLREVTDDNRYTNHALAIELPE